MTSKERVIKTINHQEPDRVPYGDFGIDHDHITHIIGRHTYWRNRKDTTMALWEGRRDEVVENIKETYSALIEKIECDVIPMELVPRKGYQPDAPVKQVDQGTWEDSLGRIYKYAASNDSIMCITHPPAKTEVSDAEVEAATDKLLDIDESEFELIDYFGEKYGQDKALVYRGGFIWEKLFSIIGGDQTHQLLMTLMAPDQIKRMNDAVIEFNKRIMNRVAEKGFLIQMQGEDFGTNNGCLMAPETLRELFFPILEKVNSNGSDCGLIPFFHCCGKIWEIVQDYIRAGCKGYQSIQGSAGMDLKTVKEKYGDHLTLWAGIQCETLVEGSEVEVEKEVMESLEIAMPGGGFIYGSNNSVQFGAKTANFLKGIELVRKHGIYK